MLLVLIIAVVAVLVLWSIATEKIKAKRVAAFQEPLKAWLKKCLLSIDRSKWVRKGLVDSLLAANPPPPTGRYTWKELAGGENQADNLQVMIDKLNETHLKHQKDVLKGFFDTVEKNPLTDEQIHACVCMDDNVLIVAAAGSGKTSTMVAKTGYVLRTGLAQPEQVLLLAFNTDAAAELGGRVAAQLKTFQNIEKVQSRTFHKFGLEVIGQATGRKPSLAPWLQSTRETLRKTTEIIDSLSQRDPVFRESCDLFRTVYGQDAGPLDEAPEPEDFQGGKVGFRTANNILVKSKQEREIGNWLFYHGVKFQYEPEYEYDTTAGGGRRQYQPDFYYPEIRLYHEHFALDANGQAPEHFKGYLEGVAWKRGIHKEKGTELFETHSHEIYSGVALQNLKAELTRRGVKLHFDPNRQSDGPPPITIDDLAETVRVFQTHVKNNGLSVEDLRRNLASQSRTGHAPRLALFLSLYEKIAEEWERCLKAGGYIDFEDMLLQAANLVESGQYKSPFTVILADEFQDSSRARIRLLKALATCRKERAHLCVVGDDWQGINRFAGSDISVMTEFEKTFENSTRLTLNTTFRCPQSLCDVSSSFIQANPIQIRKSVRTTNTYAKQSLLAYSFNEVESIADFVGKQLSELASYVRDGRLKPLRGDRVTVMLLGRYWADQPSQLERWKSQYKDVLDLEFRTAHGSKGLEAEYVFVLNMTEGKFGFPSQIRDDPVLQLAMPAPDRFPFAEERRLFYVAITRARKQVRLFTCNEKISRFLVELVKEGDLAIEAVEGEIPVPCPKCSNGVLVRRNGPYGEFLSCSRLAQCGYKKNAEPTGNATVRKSTKVAAKSGEPCPVCKQGRMERKTGKFGVFVSCSRYPKCKAKG